MENKAEKYKSKTPQAVWQRKNRLRMKKLGFLEVKVYAHNDDSHLVREFAKDLFDRRMEALS